MEAVAKHRDDRRALVAIRHASGWANPDLLCEEIRERNGEVTIDTWYNHKLLQTIKVGGSGRVVFLSISFEKTVTLPEVYGLMIKLVGLSISECGRLVGLPNSIGKLENLETLAIHDCPSLEILPPSIGKLRNLTHLSIQRCGKLRRLPKEIGKLPVVIHFLLRGCPGINELPREIGQLTTLRYLSLSHCSGLTTLSREIGLLSDLNHLGLVCCCQLERIPKEILLLQNLQYLDLRGCTQLTTTPQEIGDHNYSLNKILIDDPSHQCEFDFFVKLNKAGRCLLREHDVPETLWTHVLGKVSADINVLFYFLKTKPELCKYVEKVTNYEPSRKKQKCG